MAPVVLGYMYGRITVEAPVRRGHQRPQQVGFGVEARQQRLTFGVAEAGVVFEEKGLAVDDHDAGVEHPGVGTALGGHGGHGGHDDALHDPVADLRRHGGGGGNGAHAPGVGAGAALARRLVVPRRGQGQDGLAVGEGEEARLLAVEELLDDDLAPRGAEAPAEGLVHGRLRRRLGPRHGDPLACGQAVGLDHDRGAVRRDPRLGGGGLGKAPVGGGRDAVPGAQVLGEALGSLDGGGFRVRSERLDAGLGQPVDQPVDEGLLGADDHMVDRLAPAERHQAVDVGGRDVGPARDLADPGVAGSAMERIDPGRRADAPAQRVLATARTDDEYVQRMALRA